MASEHITALSDEQFRANRFELVSRLADDLAHEIKNPLNAIVVNLEVLKVRIGRGDPAAALERVAVIEIETRRLHHLIDRLLQLLRPEREPVMDLALDQVLDEVLPLVEAQARLARNEFTVHCSPDVYVSLPKDVLKFAILNVTTAVQERLGEGGGTLSFECERQAGEVFIRIGARARSGERPLNAAGVVFDNGLLVARLLLQSIGGRVDLDGDNVAVFLPRAAL